MLTQLSDLIASSACIFCIKIKLCHPFRQLRQLMQRLRDTPRDQPDNYNSKYDTCQTDIFNKLRADAHIFCHTFYVETHHKIKIFIQASPHLEVFKPHLGVFFPLNRIGIVVLQYISLVNSDLVAV